MTDDELKAHTQMLVDRAAIEELVKNYGRAIDLRDWELYASLFGKTVTLAYRPRKPGIPDGTIPSEQWVEGAKHSLGTLKATQHLLSCYQIAFGENDPDRAKTVHYFQAHHLEPKEQGDSIFVEHGYYEHSCERRSNGWKIVGVESQVYFATGNRNVLYGAMEDA